MSGKGGKGGWRPFKDTAGIRVYMSCTPGEWQMENVDATEEIGVTLQRLTGNTEPGDGKYYATLQRLTGNTEPGDGKYYGFGEAFTLKDAVCKQTWKKANIQECWFDFGGKR